MKCDWGEVAWHSVEHIVRGFTILVICASIFVFVRFMVVSSSARIFLGIILGAIFLSYCVGLTAALTMDLLNYIRTDDVQLSKPKVYKSNILTAIAKLEYRYAISTLDFLQMLENNSIPRTISNLDHLEWVGLVRELSSISGSPEE